MTPAAAIPIATADRNRRDHRRFSGLDPGRLRFFLVVLTSTAIAKELHVRQQPDISGKLGDARRARPLGALFFGLLADRYGRRVPLMMNLVFYSVIEVLTGFAPTFATFIFLRFLFGIGMGGEWGVGASLMMEKVSPKFRGLLSGILQEGYSFGYLLAALAYALLYPHLDGLLPGLSAWRILFIIGGFPALLALVRPLWDQGVRGIVARHQERQLARIARGDCATLEVAALSGAFDGRI